MEGYGLTRKGHEETFSGDGNVAYLEKKFEYDDVFDNTEDLHISLCVNITSKEKKRNYKQKQMLRDA